MRWRYEGTGLGNRAKRSRMMRRHYDRRAAALGVDQRAVARDGPAFGREPGMKQVELAERLDVEPITAGRIVDRLEEAGLVERQRDPVDRRAWRLFLTDKAQADHSKASAIWPRKWPTRLFAGFSARGIGGDARQAGADPGKCGRDRRRRKEVGVNKMSAVAEADSAQAPAELTQKRGAAGADAVRAAADPGRRALFLADERRDRVDRQCLCEAGRHRHLDPGQRSGGRGLCPSRTSM